MFSEMFVNILYYVLLYQVSCSIQWLAVIFMSLGAKFWVYLFKLIGLSGDISAIEPGLSGWIS